MKIFILDIVQKEKGIDMLFITISIKILYIENTLIM